MRYPVMLSLLLALAGCSDDTPPATAPQKAALDKARAAEQQLMQAEQLRADQIKRSTD